MKKEIEDIRCFFLACTIPIIMFAQFLNLANVLWLVEFQKEVVMDWIEF